MAPLSPVPTFVYFPTPDSCFNVRLTLCHDLNPKIKCHVRFLAIIPTILKENSSNCCWDMTVKLGVIQIESNKLHFPDRGGWSWPEHFSFIWRWNNTASHELTERRISASALARWTSWIEFSVHTDLIKLGQKSWLIVIKSDCWLGESFLFLFRSCRSLLQ